MIVVICGWVVGAYSRRRNQAMRTGLTNLKRIVAVLIFFCLMFSLIPANTFAVAASDISDHWAQVKIQSWMDKGLIKGYPDGTFKPDQNVTRAEFMTLANRAFGYTAVVPITYTDVKTGSWYAPKVAKAKAAGYISGYPDGTMKPENPITREEVATIVARIKNLTSDANAADKYPDAAKIGSWSKGGVGAVTSAKIMQGYPDGSFKPQGLMTRAEVVVASDNALQYTAPAAPPLTVVTPITSADVAVTKGSIDFLFSFFAGSTTPITFAQAQADLYCLDPPSSTAQLRFGSNDSSPVSSKVQLSALQISPEGKLSYDTFGSMVAAFGGSFQNIPTDIRLSLSCGVDPTISNPWTYDTLWIHFTPEEENVFALYAAPVAPSPSPASAPTPITAIGAISGTPQVGVVLTAGALTPGGATASYQWQISTDGTTYTDIGGATLSTYTPIPGDAGKFIKVVATGTGGYSGNVFTSTQAVTRTDALVSVLPSASSITYGDSISTSTLTGGSASVPGTFTFADCTVKPDAGSYTAVVTFTTSDTGTYNAVTADVNVTVGAKALTITANNASKTYGDTATLAGTAFTVVGLVNSDTFTSVTLASKGSVNTANAGTYAITAIDAVGTGLSNYIISYVPGTLTVNKATPAVVTWPSTNPITYGQLLSASGLNGGQMTYAGQTVPGVVSFITPGTITPTRDVYGNYSAAVVFTPSDTGNYNTVAGRVNVVVNKATLTVTADDKSVTYGDAVPSLTCQITGFVNGETASAVSGTAALSTAYTATTGVASSPVAITAAAGTINAANYNFIFVNGAVTINQKPITITADSSTVFYNGSMQSLSGVSSSSLISGDIITASASTSGTNAGTYTSSIAGGVTIWDDSTNVTANYNITLVPGALRIDPRGVTIVAASVSKTYDGTAFTSLSSSVDDSTPLVQNENLVSVTTSGYQINVGSSNDTPNNAVIKRNGVTDVTSNYAITYALGTLTVVSRPITITAASDSKTYDGTALTNAVSTLSGSTPLAANETLDSVTTSGSQLGAGSSDNIPSNAVIKNNGVTDVTTNYVITYVTGTLHVDPRPITVTAVTDTKTYDGTTSSAGMPTLTSGTLVDGHTGIWTQSFASSTAGTGIAIIPSGTISNGGQNVTGNYNITLVNAAGTISAPGGLITLGPNTIRIGSLGGARIQSASFVVTSFNSGHSSQTDLYSLTAYNETTPTGGVILYQNPSNYSLGGGQLTVTYSYSGGASYSVLEFYFYNQDGCLAGYNSTIAHTETYGANADQLAPTETLVGVAPTVAGNDGKITGTTTAMQYKLSTDATYTAVTGTSITGLTAGTYNVRYAAKTGYNAGTNAEVVVGAYVVPFVVATNSSTANDVSTLGIVGTSVGSSAVAVATTDLTTAAGFVTITSVGAGTATITVNDGTNTATIAVTVAADGSITIGTITKYTVVFAAKTNSSTANTKAALGLVGTSVGSSAVAVATTDLTTAAGFVTITSVGAGTATITVNDGTNTATIAVTVAADGSITIGTITKYTVVFAAKTNSSTANTKAALGLVGTSVGSSAVAVATTDLTTAAGFVTITSVGAGTATITVNDGTNTATIAVTVAADGSITIGTITKYTVVFAAKTNSSTANTKAALGLVGTSVGSSAVAVATTDLTTAAGFVTITSVGAGTATITVNDGTNTAT